MLSNYCFADVIVESCYADLIRVEMLKGISTNEDTIAAIDDYIADIETEIDNFDELKRTVTTMIEEIPDERERHIFWYRYIDGLCWRDIAEMMRYDIRHVQAIHKKTLEKLTS